MHRHRFKGYALIKRVEGQKGRTWCGRRKGGRWLGGVVLVLVSSLAV